MKLVLISALEGYVLPVAMFTGVWTMEMSKSGRCQRTKLRRSPSKRLTYDTDPAKSGARFFFEVIAATFQSPVHRRGATACQSSQSRLDRVSNRYKANRRVIKRLIIQRYRSLNRGPGEGFVRSVATGNQPTDRYDQRKAVSDDCPQTFNKHCDQ